MIDVYILNIKKCQEALISLIPYVSPRRQRVFERVLIENSKLFSIASEVILAHSLRLPLPCDYKTEDNGKPYIDGQKKFNISHSGDYAVCAVSDFEIGVDIEAAQRFNPKIITKFLAEEEIEDYKTLNQSAVLSFLCEKWVRKEAYLKLTGTGFRVAPNSLCFKGDTLMQDRAIFSKVFDISQQEKLCVCAEKEDQINLIEVTPDELKRMIQN